MTMRLTPEQYADLPPRLKPVTDQGRPVQREPSFYQKQEERLVLTKKQWSISLHLEGIPPSKKNSHIIITNPKTRRPMVIPKKEYRDWEKAAASSLLSQVNSDCLPWVIAANPCVIQILYSVKGKRAWDLSNKTESVMDALVASNIISDDNRFVIPEVRMGWLPASEDHVSITIEPA